MKEWFKYEYVYVNIDTESIYFTNSGNWSETKNLKEKGVQKSNTQRKVRIQEFLFVFLILFVILFFKNFHHSNTSLL